MKKRASKLLVHLSQNEFVLYIGNVWNGKLACYILHAIFLKHVFGLFRLIRQAGNRGRREKAIGL